MSESVAGKIRIDLLANAVQFQAGCREAGRSLGDFESQVKSFDRQFNSQKNVAARINNEQAAFKGAYGYGGANHGNLAAEIQRQSEIRWRGMLPTGNTAYSTLSRGEADQAAMFGSQMTDEGRAGGEGGGGGHMLLHSALSEAGLGRFAPLTQLAGHISKATIGIAGFAVGVLAAHSAAASLGKEIKQNREEAIKLGLTYDQYVSQKGLPQHSRFVEGAALSAEAGQEGAKGIGAGAWGALVTATDFVSQALSSIPGALVGHGSNYESGRLGAMTDVARMEDDGKRREAEMRRQIDQQIEAEKGIGSMRSKLRELNLTAEDAARADWIEKFHPREELIAQWDSLAAAIRRANAAKEASKMAEAGLQDWNKAAYGGDELKDREYADKLRAAGKSEDEIAANVRLFKSRRGETESLGRSGQALQKDLSPEEKYRQAMDDAKLRRETDFQHNRLDANQRYWTLARKATEDYYTALASKEEQDIRRRRGSENEIYQARLRDIQRREEAGLVSKKDADAQRGGLREDERKRLGVSDTLGDFARELGELRAALGSGVINQDEFARREKELRRGAAGRLMEEDPRARPLTAASYAEHGSQAAYAMIVQNRLADPHLAAQQAANAKLDQIARNTARAAAGSTGNAADDRDRGQGF